MKCPHCKSNIPDNETICVYCRKMVKGGGLQLVILLALVAATVFFAYDNRLEIRLFVYHLRHMGENDVQKGGFSQDFSAGLHEALTHEKFNQRLDSVLEEINGTDRE